MKPFLCGVIWLLAGAALAEDVAVLLPNVVKSYTVTTDGKGGAVVVPLAGVVKVGAPTNPTDPPPPPGPVLTPFEREIQAQTRTVLTNEGGSKTTGAALSEVYSRVSAGVTDGSIAPDKALTAVKTATNLVLAEMADGSSWGGWRTAVGEALTKLQQEGSLSDKAQIAAALKQVATGLNAATGYNPTAAVDPGKGILDGINIDMILKIIELIMALLKAFGG